MSFSPSSDGAPPWTLEVRGPDGSAQRISPGQVARGGSELQELRITCSAERHVVLEIDDERLEPIGPRAWSWTPGFFAGEVRARVFAPETKREATYGIDVSPNPNKLGVELFETMLEE